MKFRDIRVGEHFTHQGEHYIKAGFADDSKFRITLDGDPIWHGYDRAVAVNLRTGNICVVPGAWNLRAGEQHHGQLEKSVA